VIIGIIDLEVPRAISILAVKNFQQITAFRLELACKRWLGLSDGGLGFIVKYGL